MKKTSLRKREREFFETETTTRALVYSALLTVYNWRRSTLGFCSSWLSGFSVGAFTKGNWIGLRGYSRQRFVLLIPYVVSFPHSAIPHFTNTRALSNAVFIVISLCPTCIWRIRQWWHRILREMLISRMFVQRQRDQYEDISGGAKPRTMSGHTLNHPWDCIKIRHQTAYDSLPIRLQ